MSSKKMGQVWDLLKMLGMQMTIDWGVFTLPKGSEKSSFF